jgi:Domain of unknown function (DUF6458)
VWVPRVRLSGADRPRSEERARRNGSYHRADYDSPVGIGTSIFLIAVGAILRYAVTVTVSGIELQTVGLILMIVGIIGLVISLAVIFTAGPGGGGRRGPDEYPTRRYD